MAKRKKKKLKEFKRAALYHFVDKEVYVDMNNDKPIKGKLVKHHSYVFIIEQVIEGETVYTTVDKTSINYIKEI
ncbi:MULTISPECIES: hypothetical protein [Staphylococcus]|uniref:Uncharacterized protein n=1 Tax=Staphylococcus intermedius NCTC 11048 TaxID=1141106 RepID=A0A380FYI5_STAIN|nr:MULTISPECIES: hypothetical protein [Staphylococcus]EGQ3776074.1 hypothetical protein [Staphylococcus pseudintermedius]HDK8139670.1 hypothetical protein [Staphylococcus aureus]MDT0694124.1 hypothetical protein [Staphylococcus chromogenes]PCF80090.1 hypothetical protein B4W69_12980 [Staphylococcus delphini]PCF83898.1 hypothetical protein B4W76_12475 [Staphylococcus intermedius]